MTELLEDTGVKVGESHWKKMQQNDWASRRYMSIDKECIQLIGFE